VDHSPALFDGDPLESAQEGALTYATWAADVQDLRDLGILGQPIPERGQLGPAPDKQILVQPADSEPEADARD
jgi:hypothetical protein